MSDMPNTANTSVPTNQNCGAVPAFPRVAPAKTAADLAEAKRRLRDEELEQRIDAVRQKYDRLKRIAAEPINAQREAARIAAEAELTRLQGIIDRDPDSLEAQMAQLEIANINRNLSALFAKLDAVAYRNAVKINDAKNQEILSVTQGDGGKGGRQPGLLARLFAGQTKNARESLYNDLNAIPADVAAAHDEYEAKNQAAAGPAGALLARVGLIRRELGRATPESLRVAKHEFDRLPGDVKEVLDLAEGLEGRGGDMSTLDDRIRRALSADALPAELDQETRRALAAAVEKAMAAISALLLRFFGRRHVQATNVDYGPTTR
jgi:hypothetical protein